jgi:hypothetical protein
MPVFQAAWFVLGRQCDAEATQDKCDKLFHGHYEFGIIKYNEKAAVMSSRQF